MTPRPQNFPKPKQEVVFKEQEAYNLESMHSVLQEIRDLLKTLVENDRNADITNDGR